MSQITPVVATTFGKFAAGLSGAGLLAWGPELHPTSPQPIAKTAAPHNLPVFPGKFFNIFTFGTIIVIAFSSYPILVATNKNRSQNQKLC